MEVHSCTQLTNQNTQCRVHTFDSRGVGLGQINNEDSPEKSEKEIAEALDGISVILS